MHVITPTLKPDDSGDQVANLQAALLFLLGRDVSLFFDPLETPTPDELKGIQEALLVEASNKLFDNTTRALTFAFQQRQGLSPQDPGVVAPITADALNARLLQLGALDDDKTLAVKGRLIRAGIDEPQPGVLVRAFAVGANGEADLGKAETNNAGIYRVEFLASQLQAAPGGVVADKAIVVRAYQPDGSEMGAAWSTGAIDATTVLDVVVAFDEFVVRGRVTDTRGRPQPGLKVVAYDRDLRRHQHLGDASTDAEGRYEIGYQIEDFRRAEGQASSSADLFVVVLPNDGLEPLATSEVRLNAKPVEIIDLAVLALDKEPSEFERVASLVTPLLKGQGTPREVHHVVTDPIPTDLQPYELNAEDIEFLVHETGLDAAALQAWAEGARWQREALLLLGADAQPGDVAAINVHGWPFFFAWIRAGQSPGLMGVLRSEAQGWLSVQRNGEALARIPPANTEDWKLLVAVLQELARLAAVDDTLNSGEPLVEMLRQSPDALPRELKLDVLNIYRTEGLGNPDAFLKLTDKHPTAAKELGTFVRTLRLNDLTGGQAPLIGALNKHLGDKGDSIQALADLGAADWEGLVKKAGGQGFAVDAALYATVAVGLQLRVEQLHPVPALIARIGDDSVKLDDPDLGALRNVLTTHGDAADALLKGINLDSPAVKAIDNLKVIDTLRNFGRFGRLGLGFGGAAHLHNNGIPSPGHLMHYGSGQIRNILMNQYPQEIVDAFTNNVTNAVANITSLVASGIPLPPGNFGGAGGATAPPPVVQQITAPTVRGMFGDLDECMCRPCESVLGLPAYLVDLLNLLGKTGATQVTSGLERTALDLLQARRPSILTMPLSCENAETEVLHIDLALEVLEEAVPASAGTGLTPAARAAVALQRARFPWTLPFNAADTDLAACMERLSVTRQELMLLVAAPAASTRAAAALGLSDDERRIIADQPAANANWWGNWGFASNDSITIDDPASNEAISGIPLALLGRASVLMARTGLDLEALETALATDFVGGLAFDERGQCKTSKMHLPTQATPAAFDRLHRFTRLHRKLTGWSVAVLDSALMHLSATQAPNPLLLDGDTLNGIAQIKRAAEVLQLPPEVVLALRAWPGETRVSLNLADRTKHETLFDRVFSSKRQADRQVFAAFKQPSATPADLITSKAEAIAAAIGMDPRAVAKHAAAAGETISHASLSWLYRRHTLSQALGLSIDQLLRLVQVTGINPFLSPATTAVDRAQGFAALSALAQVSRQVADCGLPFDLAMALLQPDAPAAELPAGLRTAQQVDDWLEELKQALQAVPTPADLHVEAAELYDPIKSLLIPLFIEDVVQAVMAELVSPSGTRDTAVFKSLTGRLAHTALPDPSLLVSEDEAKLLLTPDSAGRWGKYERFAFVYERLLEHAGDVVRRVEAALAGVLPSVQVKQIMDALHDATSPSRVDAFRALTTPAVVGKTFGLGRAVFMDRTAAEALFSLAPQPPQTRIPRYREVLENIAGMQREQVILDEVARWTGWPEVSLAPFVGERLTIEPSTSGPARLAKNFYLDPAFWRAPPPPLAPADAAAAKRWARRLDRLKVLFNLSEAASAWQALQGLDWRDLIEPDAASTPSWSTRAGLLDLLWLARPENVSLNVLVEHFKRVSTATASLPVALTPLAARLKAQASDVHDLAKMVRTEPALTAALTAANLKKPQVLRATFELAMRASHLKATAAQIAILVGSDPTAAARLARQLLAAQVGADAWPARIQPIDDALRKQRRDALVAWLLQNDTVVAPTQNRKPWTQSGQIYEHYLIDPEVQPCMRTTRILQAVAAVQLFVQRILFGLEKEVTDSSLLRERWTWMRSYRLWEANRKVFLYPENWLFPELRDDKSSSFKQLEAALGQGELTADHANQAFGEFLDDVAQVGQIQVVGMFEDVEWDNPTPPATRKRTRRDLYVVGRTPNQPYRYFWRRCVDFGTRWMEWSAWHRIEINILGEHVVPFLIGEALHVAWLIARPGKQTTSGTQPELEVTFAWARFNGTNWQLRESSGTKEILNLEGGTLENSLIIRCSVWRNLHKVALQIYTSTQSDPEFKWRLTYLMDQRGIGSWDVPRNANSGVPYPTSTSQLVLKSEIADSQPRLGGYREIFGTSGLTWLNESGLPGKPSKNILTTTGNERYSVVRAAGIYSASVVWYFAEAETKIFIDVHPQGYGFADAGAALQIYAAGYDEAFVCRIRWSQLLLDGQSGTFSADRLPGLRNNAVQDPRLNPSAATYFFDNQLPYACYNWEVFFHAPLLVADQLTKQHKFEDAERWLRYVFDPTKTSLTDPKAFLRFRIFHELNPGQTVTAELTALARAAAGVATTVEVEAIKALIDRWRDLPFRPFLIARRRHLAFLWRTLFAYLDNLITWADSLYRRDTREAIGEATLLYVLAARILGPRPRIVGSRRTQSARSFEDLRSEWDDFANAWVDTTPPPGNSGAFVWGAGGTRPSNDPAPPPEGFLHFCIPVNDKLLTYWNSVEERLFNVRHCRNMEGIARDLPLLDPPIDPELLVRATAAGLDIGAVLSDLYAPLPNHRFSLLAARATELASETRSLGAALLAALEKRDTEKLSLLRSGHEINLLRRMKEVRELQIEEAKRNIESLQQSEGIARARRNHFLGLLGMAKKGVTSGEQSSGEVPPLGVFSEGLASKRTSLGLIHEENEQYLGLDEAGKFSFAAGVTKSTAGAVHMLSGILDATGNPTGAKVATAVAHGTSTFAEVFSAASLGWKNYADYQGAVSGHIRRRDEWAFQSNQTLKELQQIDKQILANQIRIAIARKEMENQTVQIEQAAAIDEYLRSKYTNVELYEWMVSQLSALHSNAYRMALDMARKAQKSAARELGLPALNLIRNDHWNSLRSGLLAGEGLHQDIERLEITYLDQNRREYELTKHVSLRRLEPRALFDLISTGACEFDIPEWLFDMDTPGHYMRRIKTVSAGIPCVVGPYASVNCKLTLLKNESRHAASSSGRYAKATEADDTRFTVRYGATESIVTSTGRDDSGLFETALRDERYLPFESAGVISSWRLELPGTPRQFDFGTISDVILHMRYTAREGGDGLKALAQQQFSSKAGAALTYPKVLLSCRNEFPNEWNAAKANKTSLKIGLSLSLLPYWMQTQGLNVKIKAISTLILPASRTVAQEPKVIWSGGLPPQSGLGVDGIGIADVGSVEGAEDLFVLLDVG